MKKNGFTLVEILAVLVILGVLIALSIPAYTTVMIDVKRDNYNSKVKEMEIAANKYGEKVKDEVKNTGNACYNQEISSLVRRGYLLSESDYEDIILDPITNEAYKGTIKTCYCKKTYDIKSYYVEDFNPANVYYEGNHVLYKNRIYICKYKYPGNVANGINGIFHDDKKNKDYSYFEEETC